MIQQRHYETMTFNERVLRTFSHEPTDRVPLGRYQATRAICLAARLFGCCMRRLDDPVTS